MKRGKNIKDSRLKHRLKTVAALCITVATAYASPVIRRPLNISQPDGSILTVLPEGDEYGVIFTTTDGITVKKLLNDSFVYSGDTTLIAHNPSERSNEEIQRISSMKNKRSTDINAQTKVTTHTYNGNLRIGEMTIHQGSPKIPVILVAFADKPFSEQDPKSGFETRLCRPATIDEVEQGQGSAYQYFCDQSHNLFTPSFDIIGPITLSENAVNYANNETEMIRQAVKAASDEGLVKDWSIYDQNNDGLVDASYIIYAGEGQHAHPTDATLIWPHTSTFMNNAPQADGVSFYSYSCCNETLYGQIDGFGTFCHELSHQLGLPDFYRTDGVTTGSFNMGPWSVMDYGSYNENGFLPVGYRAIEKWAMGWEEPILLDKATTVKEWPVGAEAFRICNDIEPEEYYLLETVGHSGWNKACPAEGVLISHIYLPGGFENTYWKDNTLNNANPPRVHLIAADNSRTQLVTGVNEDEYAEDLKGDLYPNPQGNNQLTDSSTPSAEVYVGLWGYMGKPITDIYYDAQTERASFLFMGGSDENIITNTIEVENGLMPGKERWWSINGVVYENKPQKQGVYIHQTYSGNTVKEIIK